MKIPPILCTIFSIVGMYPVFAGQENFSKSLEDTQVQFNYTLSSPLSVALNEIAPIEFSIKKEYIDTAYNIIPRFSVLQQIVGEKTISLANEIARKYLSQIHQAYTSHVAAQKAAVAKAKLPEGIDLILECPETAVEYEYVYNKKSQSYSHNTRTRNCSISLNSKQSIVVLKEKIRKDVEATSKMLAHGSVYQFKDTSETGYSFDYSLSAPNNQVMQEYKSLVEASQQRIATMSKEFDYYQQYSESLYKQLSNNGKAFFDELKPVVSAVIANITTEMQELSKKLYKENFLLMIEDKNNYLIRLDYKSIVEASKPYLSTVASALKDTSLDRRTQINKILHFLQSIPYNTLQGRDIEGYSGFLTPLALLDKNQGDCDSKSVAFIALMNILLPDIDTIMVLIDNHAFVAIGIPSQVGETSFTYQGINYVAVEAVGPAISSIGNISEQSERAIANNAVRQVIRID